MAEITVPYEFDGRQFEGKVVWDDSVAGARPVVFMQPDWYGVCDRTTKMAAEIASTDYVVLLADMNGVGYGDREKDQDELLKHATGARQDLKLVVEGGGTAFDALLAEADKRGLADTGKIGGIGFCMGGGIVLEQARAGAGFKGTIVFHVTQPNPHPDAGAPAFKGRVLAIHGAADPVTPKPMMDALEAELTEAGVDWQVMTFGNGSHSFCVEGEYNPPVQIYDEKLCRQSYRLMRDFFAETF